MLAACAGAIAVGSWVQGTGECTAVGSEGNTTAATVEVGDGTWTATVADEGFPTAGDYEGTWSLATGTLRASDGEGHLEGTFIGIPENTDHLGTLAGATWGDNEGSMSVSATIDSVSIAYTDERVVTSTSCAKQ